MGNGGVEQFEENVVTSYMDDPCSEKGVWHWFFLCYMPLWGTSKKAAFCIHILCSYSILWKIFLCVSVFFSMSVCFVLFFNFFFQVWQKCFVSFSISFQGFSVYFFHFFSLIHDKDLYTSLILFLLKKEEVSMAWKKFVLIVYTRQWWFIFFKQFSIDNFSMAKSC